MDDLQGKSLSEISTIFLSYIKEARFVDLLLYCLKTASKNGLSKKIGCSHHSLNRYINGQRMVPICLIKNLVKAYHIDEKQLFEYMNDDSSTYCSAYIPNTIDGKIIWYGGDNDIINSLFAIRTFINPMSFFQLSYLTEINPERLARYECGKKMIPPTDVERILNGLSISLTELFPQLCSYDGNQTFVPLGNTSLKISNNKFWTDCYIDDMARFGEIITIQNWPINRYDCLGKIISNAMPNELTMDEYYNTDDIFFYNFTDNSFFDGPSFDYKTLPPNYYRYQLLFLDQTKEPFEKIIKKTPFHAASNLEIVEPNIIKIIWDNDTTTILNIESYVNSASKWYQELNNFEYLNKAMLYTINPDESDTQVILWPNGQYLRIDEIPLDIDPYHTCFEFCGLGCTGKIVNWMKWS